METAVVLNGSCGKARNGLPEETMYVYIYMYIYIYFVCVRACAIQNGGSSEARVPRLFFIDPLMLLPMFNQSFPASPSTL